VLLPVSVLARRADAVTVIGSALAGTAAGRIAEALGRPVSTMRGWLRQFASRAGGLRSAFTRLLCELDADPLLPAPAGSELADAVSAVLAAAAAVARRWGAAASGLSPWELACVVTSARLLARRAGGLANTSCLW
jgi:transposase-like protein